MESTENATTCTSAKPGRGPSHLLEIGGEDGIAHPFDDAGLDLDPNLRRHRHRHRSPREITAPEKHAKTGPALRLLLRATANQDKGRRQHRTMGPTTETRSGTGDGGMAAPDISPYRGTIVGLPVGPAGRGCAERGPWHRGQEMAATLLRPETPYTSAVDGHGAASP